MEELQEDYLIPISGEEPTPGKRWSLQGKDRSRILNSATGAFLRPEPGKSHTITVVSDSKPAISYQAPIVRRLGGFLGDFPIAKIARSSL